MGVKDFLKECIFNNPEHVPNRHLVPSRMTLIDGNAFFYGGVRLSKAIKNESSYYFTDEDHQLIKQCPAMKKYIPEFICVMQDMEYVAAQLPIIPFHFTILILAFDGTSPVTKWCKSRKTLRDRMKRQENVRAATEPQQKEQPQPQQEEEQPQPEEEQAEGGGEEEEEVAVEIQQRVFDGGLKPWTPKSMHLKHYLEDYLDRPVPAEAAFARYYDAVVTNDMLIPGEGDFKLAAYVSHAWRNSLIHKNDYVTVVTDDSDLLFHMLTVWLTVCKGMCEIQIVFRRKSRGREGWYVVRMSDFARYVRVVPEDDKIETKLSNLLFLLSLHGNDFIPAVARFPLTRKRFEVITDVVNKSVLKIYHDKKMLAMALELLSATCKKKNPSASSSSRISVDRMTIVRQYLRAALWNVAYFRHMVVPWFSDEVVTVANGVVPFKVSDVTFDEMLRAVRFMSDDDFETLGVFELYDFKKNNSFPTAKTVVNDETGEEEEEEEEEEVIGINFYDDESTTGDERASYVVSKISDQRVEQRIVKRSSLFSLSEEKCLTINMWYLEYLLGEAPEIDKHAVYKQSVMWGSRSMRWLEKMNREFRCSHYSDLDYSLCFTATTRRLKDLMIKTILDVCDTLIARCHSPDA